MGANASTAVPVYVSGQVLDAARLNLTNAGIPVFGGTATRDAAFGGTGEKTLAEGQFAYLEDTNTTQYYDGAAWQSVGASSAVVQVKSVTKTNTFTTTSTSFVDLTDLTLSITPTSASNKILCFYFVIASGLAGTNMGGINLVRGATAISQADASGVRSVASSIVTEVGTEQSSLVSNSFLDSPATTSATTYKLQIRTGGAGTITVNRTNNAVDNVVLFNGTSSLTIMEVTP
jgi:hypothetical protein